MLTSSRVILGVVILGLVTLTEPSYQITTEMSSNNLDLHLDDVFSPLDALHSPLSTAHARWRD